MEEVARVKREEERKREGKRVEKEECVEILKRVFEDGFTDDRDAMLREGLGFGCSASKTRSWRRGCSDEE